MERQILTGPAQRRSARHDRDRQWRTLELIAEHNPLYICWWNKNRRHDRAKAPPDLLVCSLITGSSIAGWLHTHPNWVTIGEWDDARYAAPAWITPAGTEALANRHLYDMEPVEGGMIEPGWLCTPLEPDHPALTADAAAAP